MFSRKIKHLLFFAVIFWVAITTNTQAQSYTVQSNQLGIEDGLSSYNISHIIQGKRGFIWIATDYGLNRYDGVQVKSYTKEESGLCSNNIVRLEQDEAGNIWVFARTNHMLCYTVFDPIKEKFFTPEAYLGFKLPFDLSKTEVSFSFYQKSILFVAKSYEASSFQYYEYDGTTTHSLFSNFDIQKQYPEYYINALYKFPNGSYGLYLRSLNIAKPSFVLLLDAKGNKIKESLCPPNYTLYHIWPGKRETFCGICLDRSSPNGWKAVMNLDNELTVPISIKELDKELVYYANNKIYTINDAFIQVYNKRGQLLKKAANTFPLTNSNNKFFVDQDENFWLSNDKYLYRFNLVEQLFVCELSDQVPQTKIRGICQDQKGNIYAGGIGFLLQKANNIWQNKAIIRPNLLHNTLGLLQEGTNLWVGLEEGFLVQYELPSMKAQLFDATTDSLSKTYMYWAIHQAKDKKIWVGTYNGLYYLDKTISKLVPFGANNKDLSSSTIFAFHPNNHGTWLSTSKGLFLVDLELGLVKGHFSNTQLGDHYIPAEQIAHLYEDKNAVFWLASKGDGLIRWDYKTRKHKQYTQKGAGLSHNMLYAVYGDAYDNLWLSSQRGLMCFHKLTEHVQIFLEADALPHDEFNTIAHYQGKDGRLYFGGQNGLVHFDPKNFYTENKLIPIVITDCFKKNKKDSLINHTEEILLNGSIILSPNDKSFSLSFALLDYKNAKDHQYSYQIVGYDKDWNYLDKNNLFINNLPYGNYELKLRAKSAHSSQWIGYPNSINIQVLKPFYLKTWFLLLAAFLLLVLLFVIIKWREQILLKRQNELEIIVEERTAKIAKDKMLIEEQSAELKSLDELKSRFFANISHELRTPLTLILGPLSYLLDNPEAWEAADIKRQLLTMQRNGKSLMQLIEEILDLSKMEANKLELNEEPTHLKDFFTQLYSSFKPRTQNLQLNFQLHVDIQSQNLVALLDQKKIEKVVNNFLSNAIKFTAKGGKIDLFLSESNNMFQIEVRDTGIGIQPKDLPHIFERFYQSKALDQKLYGGTGIGLALVSEFASLMQGKAYAHSELGKGSSLFFEFPKKLTSLDSFVGNIVDNELEEELIESIGTDFTIMVVEDNIDLQDFICQLLQKRYSKVIVANNGAEALQKLEELGTEIQLIISDIMMPEVDGLTLLKTVKSNPIWKTIPIIMLTAIKAEKEKLTALTTGVDDYLTKPFSVSELLVRVQNLLYNYHQRLQWQQEEENDFEFEEEEEKKALYEAKSEENQLLWIKEVEALVKQNIPNNDLSIESLSEQLFISTRQLNRKIKAITGLTAAKFVREIQLQIALNEMESGNFVSISEIAYNAGFENPNSFSTIFKKRFGKPPTEYLNKVV